MKVLQTAERKAPPGRLHLWDCLGLLVLVAVANALRLSHAWRGGLWRDEAQFLNIVALPSGRAMMDFIVHHESHPPLYFFMMRWWLAGRDLGEHALVVPGMVLGTLTLLLAWWLGRRLGSRATAWVAALFVALSPRLIETDATVRPYSFATLVLLCAIAFLWRALSTGSVTALAGWVFAGVILLYTHNWTVLPVVASGAAGLWLSLTRRTPLAPRSMVLAGFAMVVCWAPWVPTLVHQAQHGGHMPPRASPLIRGPWLLASSFPGLSIETGMVLVVGLAGVFLLRKRVIIANDETRKWLILTGLVTLLVALGATLGSFRTELLLTHTIPMLAPPILISIALILTAPDTRAVLLTPTALILVLLMSARDSVRMAGSPRSNADVVARYLSSVAGPEDVVVLMPGNLISSFERNYSGTAPLYPFPQGSGGRPIDFVDRIPRESDPAVLAAAIDYVGGTMAGGGRIWEVSVGVEVHLEAGWDELGSRLRSLGGTPEAVSLNSTMRKATLEQVRVQVWARSGPRASTGQ